MWPHSVEDRRRAKALPPMLCALLLLPLSGCQTTTGQGFTESSTDRTEYSAPDPETGEQYTTAEEATHTIDLKDESEAGILAGTNTNHLMFVEQTDPGKYWIQIGGTSELRGSDLASLLEELAGVADSLTGLVERATGLVESLNPAVSVISAIREDEPDAEPLEEP